MDIEKLYTPKEAAQILSVTYQTMMSYIWTEKLKAVKVGGKWKIKQSDLDSFINGK